MARLLTFGILVLALLAAPRTLPAQGTWRVGDRAEVSWTGSWYPARILEARDGKYRIRYDGYDASWDEWVTPARMRQAAAPVRMPAPASAGKAAAKPPATGAGSASPAGRYVCQTWTANQLQNVGEFVLADNGTYRDFWNKGNGRYTYDAKTRRIRFTSGPQKTDKATITFSPRAGRGARGRVEFAYRGGATLHCYR